MRKFLLLILILSPLFLSSGSFALNQVQGQNQNVYHLALEGSTWNKTTLKILLVQPNNESWWNPGYLNDTLRAIGQWNDALQYFASNYTNYAYLSLIKLDPTVSNHTQNGFDVYLNWTENELGNTADIAGLTTTVEQNNVVINDSVNLATHSSYGIALADGDEQNIALHELGHVLGILCTNNTGEIMTPEYSLLSSEKLISTLDVYGVARVFAWVTNASSFYPVSQWLPNNPVILPANIPYQFLPIPSQDAVPQTLENNPVVQNLFLFFELLLTPEFFPFAILLVAVLVILLVIVIFPTIKKELASKAASQNREIRLTTIQFKAPICNYCRACV